jgi:hypothetical protein
MAIQNCSNRRLSMGYQACELHINKHSTRDKNTDEIKLTLNLYYDNIIFLPRPTSQDDKPRV